ncbi:D-xylose-proton symporter-like 3, chloroplastic isoform X1 [Setaria italica]|uniref:D-xylose-proton symporter-like 3, chloroplastic isoform X1 n=1 Tax=Setaria italica TaxID=4555 RepID=UPI000350D03D|nr:D-xylose-proton symporter-like 3, chloroplastic isoform X1 [Setaria italica]
MRKVRAMPGVAPPRRGTRPSRGHPSYSVLIDHCSEPRFLFPALGGLLFGYDIGATSGATISVQSADLSGTTWFNRSSVQLGLVASGSLYGALGGSILAHRIADFLGRRIELVTAAALYILGALVTGFAPNFVGLIIGRILYGIGIGLVSTCRHKSSSSLR